jgi:uncharacterized membrane protein (UPF0127 family)
MTRRLFLLCIAGIVSAFTLQVHADTLETGVLDIRSVERTHRFTVEIADEAHERSKGLMFRESLDADAGMLFIYPNERIASFWMKNTYIPLDMLFIANDGEILEIAPQVPPLTLESVRSAEPVRAVLELNGGQAAELGIRPGDRVVLYR